MKAVKLVMCQFHIVIVCGLLLVAKVNASTPPTFNQLGFLPHGSKIVVVPNVEAGAFYLVDESNNHEMLRGPLSQPQKWGAAGQTVKVADFTAFNKPGVYRVRVPGLKDSQAFTIGDNVYDGAIGAVATSFFYHRAGAPLQREFAGDFARPSQFSDLLVNTNLNSRTPSFGQYPMGWFNGVDYGKSVIANTVALAGMLHAYQDDAKYFNGLKLSIPESQVNKSDLLQEALWSLRWLLTMQDKTDGGVHHAIATHQTKGINSSDINGRALMPKSTAATLNFAAVMALASHVATIEGSGLGEYKNAFEQAALNAWQWAKKHPKQLYVQPTNYFDAPYALATETLADEWFWAASELWALTAKKEFFKAIELPSAVREGGWPHVEMWGLFRLAEFDKTPAKQKQAIEQLLNKSAHSAAQALWQSGYLVPMSETDFTYNSNGIALMRAMLLLKTNHYTPNKDYEPAARSLLDYLFGRNPMQQSFVTGFGFNSVKKPQHGLSMQYKKPLPGLVVMGPDAGASENCKYSFKFAAMAYIDDTCSVTNSASLDRQGVLLYVLSQLREAKVE